MYFHWWKVVKMNEKQSYFQIPFGIWYPADIDVWKGFLFERVALSTPVNCLWNIFCIFCLHLSKTLFVIELKFDRTLVLIFYEGKFLLGVNNFLQQENKEKKICWLPYEENRRNCWHFVCHVCCSNNVPQKNSKLADSYFHFLISWFIKYHWGKGLLISWFLS